MLSSVDKFPIKIGSTQPTCYNIINHERGEIMTIGERLLNLRKEKNISQEELADILGVSRQTISKWELDQTTPDFDKLVPLCEYFGITSDELLTGKKNYVEEKAKDKKTSFAALLSISIALYIISIIFVVLFSAVFAQPIIGVCLFLITVAIATGLIIFNGIVNKSDKKEKIEKKENEKVTLICEILDIICLIAYFVISFLTGAWYITWVIFLVMGLLNTAVKLIFSYSKKEEEAEDEE